MAEGFWARWFFYLELFLKIPWGAAMGVTKEAGSYHPAVKAQNLAVSAAGPNASKWLALAAFPSGVALMAFGRMGDIEPVVFGGRLLFTVGAVALFDFLLADPGKYRAFRERQGEAARKAKPCMR
jgi:hypothetical protein